MLRPIGYYFSSGVSASDNITEVFRDIHNIGNPAIYWLSTLAMLAVLILWLKGFIDWFKRGKATSNFSFYSVLLVGYCTNLLPLALVSRCLFFYHYQPSSIFAMIALAFFIGRFIQSKRLWVKSISFGVITIILISFIYWGPHAVWIGTHTRGIL